MQQKVNYILHLNKAFQKLYLDQRLSPFHISLYYSLFQFWNISKFKSPMSISRDDQMQASKIGSVNTYLKCLKELHAWGYIRYEPSHNPMKGSLVYLYNFDTTVNTRTDITDYITGDKDHSNSPEQSRETTLKRLVRPSINSLNKSNKLNPKSNEDEKTNLTNDRDFNSLGEKSATNDSTGADGKIRTSKEKKEKLREKKKFNRDSNQSKTVAKTGFTRPVLQLVTEYFESQEWPKVEGQKFFNHYESNGWLVGGKTPMANWHSSAANWMLNTDNFKDDKKYNRAGKIATSTEKNYSEPL